MAEFVEGYEILKNSDPCIVVFGSARTLPGTQTYVDAEKTGKLLAEKGYTVITGGGPGVMEAINKGACEAKGKSVGFNITLPFEQCVNNYVTHSITFDYFFIRKAMFANYSKAFIMFPGGFGTMDEFFDIITLIQTGKIPKRPIIIYDRVFYDTLLKMMEYFVKEKTISPEDMDLIQYADTPEELLKLVEKLKD
jgi:uncharacterized protein (TIGR00730 family)